MTAGEPACGSLGVDKRTAGRRFHPVVTDKHRRASAASAGGTRCSAPAAEAPAAAAAAASESFIARPGQVSDAAVRCTCALSHTLSLCVCARAYFCVQGQAGSWWVGVVCFLAAKCHCRRARSLLEE